MLIFLTGLIYFVASLLSSMSGGGVGIITFASLSSLGVPGPLILSTSSISGIFWVLPASKNYLTGRKVHWKFLILFALLGLVGTYISVMLVISVNQYIFQKIIGCIILFLVFYTLFKKDLGVNEHVERSSTRKLMAYPFALLLGFYENFFGSGNGIAFSLVTFYTRGFDFIDALGHYYAISFVWLIFGGYIFYSKGIFDLNLIIAATIGCVIGSFIGSKYARYKGNKFIKTLFIIIGAILGLKLILGI